MSSIIDFGMERRLRSYLVVFIQLASFVLILLSGPLFARTKPYFIVEMIGIGMGLWALFEFRKTTFRITPEVGEGAVLIVSGPYKLIRNPMYTSLLLIALALILDWFTIWRLAIFVVLLVDLLVKINIEEKYLLRHFKNYSNYKKYTYRLIPPIF